MTPRIPLAICATLMLSSPALAALDIPSTPLEVDNVVNPNIVFVLDNSGSMDRNYMPDEADYSDFRRRSPYHNKIYFDPNSDYTPPPYAFSGRYPDSSFSKAWKNGFNQNDGTQNIASDPNVTEDFHPSKKKQILKFVTYLPKQNCSNYDDSSCFIRYVYDSDCSGVSSSDVCSSKPEDLVKVANWYSYYRTRILMAKSAVLRAFSNMNPDFRFGYYAINNSSITQVSPFGDGSANTTKAKFWSWMAGMTPSGGTPLRKALSDVGEYYTKDQPWQDDKGNKLACRQSFAILTTDGYWNESYKGVGNADGTDGEVITSPDGKKYQYKPAPPFSDGAGKSYSNTLADVAMYYWKNDLRTDLDNKVPTTATDPAFWQHMSTFTISLGLDPTRLKPDGTTIDQVFKWGLHGGPAISGFYWPQPAADSENNIADLAHAGLNGRGGFFSAKNPTQFAEAINNALATISDRSLTSTSVSVTSQRVQADTLLFNASYNPADWSGKITAYPVTSSGVDTDHPKWVSSVPSPDKRTIVTWNGSSGQPFLWDNLSKAQQQALNNDPTLLAYLRGDQSGEVRNGGNFRNRNSLIGDIVHSSPVYSKTLGTVFAGANDGMLHAFDAASGQELFAYVPGAVAGGQMYRLADPDYNRSHRYFVDGPIAVTNPSATGGRSLLVGSLGYGGNTLFALDVSTPRAFSPSAVKWEITPSDLGILTGPFLVLRLNNGKTAIVTGNGYNSAPERAMLLVYDLADGSLIAKVDTGVGSASATNGLSPPVAFDADANGTYDYVYAGDLQGNLWKFDLTSTDPGQWKVALSKGGKPAPLFTATDASGKAQPITGGPEVAINPADGTLWVFFGTGRYLTTGDVADTSVQSWYGIIDDGSNPVTRDQLKLRKIVATATQNNRKVAAFEAAVAGDMTGKKGWVVDLPAGERFISAPVMDVNVLVATSIVPLNDPCTPGLSGYLNAIDPFTGGATKSAYFTDFTAIKDPKGNDLRISKIELSGPPGPPVNVFDIESEEKETIVNKDDAIPVQNNFIPGVGWREIILQ